MTHAEADKIARSLVAWGARGILNARLSAEGDRIVFGGTGARTGTHSLDVGASSRDRVLTHWRGFVMNNGGALTEPEAPHKTPPAQLDREIAEVLKTPPVGKQRVRRLAVVTFWGRPGYKAGGEQKLVEFTKSDRFAQAWNASGQRFNKSYEIDTHDKGKAFAGYVRPDGSIDPLYPARKEPDSGVKNIRPATLKDLKRFKFKLPPGHTLAEQLS
jgi:hypothetical protein